MQRLTDKAAVYNELYEALTVFMGRQQLTVRAVIEQGVSPADLKDGVAGWHDKTPQVGEWGQHWRFHFHGGGCELKHRETGEPVDWNGPDPHAFGKRAFVYHLAWRLGQDHDLPHLHAVMQDGGEQAIIALIDDLIADGIITADRHLVPARHADAA